MKVSDLLPGDIIMGTGPVAWFILRVGFSPAAKDVCRFTALYIDGASRSVVLVPTFDWGSSDIIDAIPGTRVFVL
jgi:hypothetical protein